MSTIITVHAERTWTEPRPFTDADWRKVTRAVYSIDGYSPVRVTIYVGETVAFVRTTSMPDGRSSWWREPRADQRRALLDEVLAPLGLRRVPGSRQWNPSADAWHWQFDIEPV